MKLMLKLLTDPMRAGQSSGRTTERAGMALIIGVGVLLGWRYLVGHGDFIPGDFRVYLTAWQRVAQGGSPYVATDFSPFKYSPGALALVQFLPSDPLWAWRVFGALSIAGLVGVVSFGTRIRDLKSLGLLVLGLALSWKGILETLNYGQMELVLLALATFAAAHFERRPGLTGVVLGLLPAFKLPWILVGLPFFLISHMEARRRGYRFKRFFTGYFFGWFGWFCMLPSLCFGPDAVTQLTRQWIALLRVQPHELFYSDVNQSLWVTVLRLFPDVPRFVVLGGAAVLVGLTLGRLVAQVHSFPGRRVIRAHALGWIAPWLVFTQWVNPLAWRWGSALAFGIPFAYDRAMRQGGARQARVRKLAFGLALVFWVLQKCTDLDAYGVVSFYWLALIWMS